MKVQHPKTTLHIVRMSEHAKALQLDLEKTAVRHSLKITINETEYEEQTGKTVKFVKPGTLAPRGNQSPITRCNSIQFSKFTPPTGRKQDPKRSVSFHRTNLAISPATRKQDSSGSEIIFQYDSSESPEQTTPREGTQLPSFKDERILQLCLQHLNNIKAYKTEGIFRICGNFDKLQEIKQEICSSSSPRNSLLILHELGVHGVVDLFKDLIVHQGFPLLDESCYNNMYMLPEIKFLGNKKNLLSEEEVICIYITSVFNSYLSKENYELLFNLLQFLHLVIEHEEESRMGVRALGTILAPLLFGYPGSSQFDEYLLETSRRISLVIYLLELFKKCSELFIKYKERGPLETMYCKKTIHLLNHSIRTGNEIAIFHTTQALVFGRHEDVIFVEEAVNCKFSNTRCRSKGGLLRSSVLLKNRFTQ